MVQPAHLRLTRPSPLRLAALALAYALVAKAVLAFFSANGVVSIVWPPSGIALAALVLGGRGYWPGVFLGALAGNLLAGSAPAVSLAIAVGNTLEALAGLWLLDGPGRFDAALTRPRHFARLAWAAAASAGVAALVGTTTLRAAGILTTGLHAENLLHWWQGDVLGMILVTPLLLVWRDPPREWLCRRRAAELAAFLPAGFLCGQAIFLGWFREYVGPVALSYWTFLFVAWGAVRFGRHGALLVISMTAVQALVGSALGAGPFGRDVSVASLENFWFYMLVLTLVGLSLASVIAERELTEGELKREEEKFHTMADHTYDWEYWQGVGHEILFMSPSCERVTGYTPAEFAADPGLLERIVHPEDRPRVVAHAHDAAHVEEASIDFRILRRDGEPRWIAHGCRAVFGRDGHFLGRRSSNRDITERRAAEDAVRGLNADLERRVAQRTAQLEAANQELEEFSYSMSHDMRAPLRAIHGYSQILLAEHGESLGAEGRRLQGLVGDNARHMGRLIDDILHFLNLRRRKMTATDLDLAALAQEAFADLVGPAPAGPRLAVAALPPAWGDREMIREVLRNLLANALKFAAPERPALIEIGGTAGAGENAYFVRDNGVGFDMRYADKLFRVFERLHPAGQYEGTAMGLAVVKRIVERHRGRVWAEGKVGAGTTVHFTLPPGRA